MYYMYVGQQVGRDAILGNMHTFEIFTVISYAIWIGIILLIVASNCALFDKAGYKPWKAIVPLYNTIILSKIATGKSDAGIIAVLATVLMVFFKQGIIGILLNLIAIVVSLYMLYKLCTAYGKGAWYLIFIIFASVIAYPMLAFGSSTYIGGGRGNDYHERNNMCRGTECNMSNNNSVIIDDSKNSNSESSSDSEYDKWGKV